MRKFWQAFSVIGFYTTEHLKVSTRDVPDTAEGWKWCNGVFKKIK